MNQFFKEITQEIENMTNAELKIALEEAECGDLRWALEYAWDSELDEYLEWKTCYKHMWE